MLSRAYRAPVDTTCEANADGRHELDTYTARVTDRPNLSKSSSATPAAPGTKPAPPRFVLIAAAALALSGLAAILASMTLYVGSVKTWVRDGTRDSISDQMSDKFDDVKKAGPSTGDRAADLTALQRQIKSLKDQPSDQLGPAATQIKADIAGLLPGASAKGKGLLDDLTKQANQARDLTDSISSQQKSALIRSIVVFVALGVAAAATFRGRHWARWATLGLWVLATFTGTLAGLGSVISVAADIPLLLKVPAFISGLALVVAVVLTNLRPSVAFFNIGRPDRGNRPQRRGLFSPAAARTPATKATPAPDKPAGSAGPDRARTKARTSEAAVAKGAELARTRAKASKSRRTGV